MKPSQIKKVLDIALKVRLENAKRGYGEEFNPLFVGAPGLGKSKIVQEWIKENNYYWFDLRGAYLEAPDLIGMPKDVNQNGELRTVHVLPDYLPKKQDRPGVLLIEEPNRANRQVMNALMQLLTDRKIHKYELPDDWIIVGCINPDNSEYDVNTMDAALKDRFRIFYIDYDKESLIKYAESKKWDKILIEYIRSIFKYKTPEELADNPTAKYVSPRSLASLNSILQVLDENTPKELEFSLIESCVGTSIASEFFAFKHDKTPVLYQDLVNNTSKALYLLEKYSNPDHYENALISITIDSILNEGQDIKNTLLIKVLEVIPADQCAKLIQGLEYKRKLKGGTLLKELTEKSDKLLEKLKRKGA